MSTTQERAHSDDVATVRTTTYREHTLCGRPTGTLYDVLDLILDRGMVIDVFIRVSLVGIEILKIDARIVVASVDTYLRFAEICNRLDLANDPSARSLPEMLGGMGGSVGKKKVKSVVGQAAESVSGSVREALGGKGKGSKSGKGGKKDEGEDNQDDGDGGGEEGHRGHRTRERSRSRRGRGSEED